MTKKKKNNKKKEIPNKKNISRGKLEGRETRRGRAMNGKSAQT